MEPICKACHNRSLCKKNKSRCPAINELYDIYNARDHKFRTALTKILSIKLGIRDAHPSKDMRMLAESIMDKFIEFRFISDYGIKIGYVQSYENKTGPKITYADCRKLNEVYKAYLPFDFIITFYYYNTEILSENQKKIIMLHELKHIQITERGLTVRPHDIEDFKDILARYGNEWNEFNQEVPDILGGE